MSATDKQKPVNEDKIDQEHYLTVLYSRRSITCIQIRRAHLELLANGDTTINDC